MASGTSPELSNEMSVGAGCMPERNVGGAAVADLDLDGWDDLIFARTRGAPVVYRNLGGLAFEDVTTAWGVDSAFECRASTKLQQQSKEEMDTRDRDTAKMLGYDSYQPPAAGCLWPATSAVAVEDIDRDGRPDLLFATMAAPVAPPVVVIRNIAPVNSTGLLSFEDITQESGFESLRPAGGQENSLTSASSIAFGSASTSGLPDAYVGEWRVYLQARLGRGSPVTNSRLLRQRPNDLGRVAAGGRVKLSAAGADDGQGVAVFRDATTVAGVELHARAGKLLIRRRRKYLSAVQRENGAVGNGVFSFLPIFGDFTEDGEMDLFVTGDFMTSVFFNGSSSGRFTEQSDELGLGIDENGMGACVTDIDSDGRLDILVAAIHSFAPPDPNAAFGVSGNRLYRWNGESFEDQADAFGVAAAAWAWSCAWVEPDRRGPRISANASLRARPTQAVFITNGFDIPETTLDDDKWLDTADEFLFPADTPHLALGDSRPLEPVLPSLWLAPMPEVECSQQPKDSVDACASPQDALHRMGRAVLVSDLDRDGDDDLVVATHADAPFLLESLAAQRPSTKDAPWLRMSLVQCHERECFNVWGATVRFRLHCEPVAACEALGVAKVATRAQRYPPQSGFLAEYVSPITLPLGEALSTLAGAPAGHDPVTVTVSATITSPHANGCEVTLDGLAKLASGKHGPSTTGPALGQHVVVDVAGASEQVAWRRGACHTINVQEVHSSGAAGAAADFEGGLLSIAARQFAAAPSSASAVVLPHVATDRKVPGDVPEMPPPLQLAPAGLERQLRQWHALHKPASSKSRAQQRAEADAQIELLVANFASEAEEAQVAEDRRVEEEVARVAKQIRDSDRAALRETLAQATPVPRSAAPATEPALPAMVREWQAVADLPAVLRKALGILVRASALGQLRPYSVDGKDNDARHPTAGGAFTPLARLLKPDYGDALGIGASPAGLSRPSARALSLAFFDESAPSQQQRLEFGGARSAATQVGSMPAPRGMAGAGNGPSAGLGVPSGGKLGAALSVDGGVGGSGGGVGGGDMLAALEGLARDAAARPRADAPAVPTMTQLDVHLGQLVAHELSHTTPQANAAPQEAMLIDVPESDPWFGSAMRFRRSIFAPNTSVSEESPRQQVNKVTAWIDGSVVYGSDSVRQRALRDDAVAAGFLLSGPGGPWQPLPRASAAHSGSAGLANDNPIARNGRRLLIAGDARTNVQPGIASLHSALVREHNWLAAHAQTLVSDEISLAGDVVFEAVRALVTMELQLAVARHYLDRLLGPPAARRVIAAIGEGCRPDILNEFSTAIFRVGHLQQAGGLPLKGAPGTHPAAGANLTDSFFLTALSQPGANGPGTIDPEFWELPAAATVSGGAGLADVLRGAATAPARPVGCTSSGSAAPAGPDAKHGMAHELQHSLFGAPGSMGGGLDLGALNIQRGRDHGLPSFERYGEALLNGELPMCSQHAPPALSREVAAALQSELVSGYRAAAVLMGSESAADSDTDLFVGMVCEAGFAAADGGATGVLGPIGAWIAEEQFTRVLASDRRSAHLLLDEARGRPLPGSAVALLKQGMTEGELKELVDVLSWPAMLTRHAGCVFDCK